MQKLDDGIEHLRQDMMELKAGFSRLNDAIVGNGKPGLRMQVDRVERWQQNYDSRRRGRVALWTIVFSSILGTMLYAIREHLIHIIGGLI